MAQDKPDLMEGKHRRILANFLAFRALNVHRNIRDRARFRDFQIPRLLFVNMHQTGPRRAFTIQQPDVGCDIEPTAKRLD